MKWRKYLSSQNLLIAVLIIFGIVMRFLPHPPNFTPMAALALFSGVYLSKRRAMLIPLLAMVASDFVIGFHNLVLFTWGSFALVAVIGWYVRRKKNVATVITGSIAGSVIFYLITNFAVWAFTPLYAKTLSGLVASYTMAIPFFRNMFMGDLFYVAILFGAYELVWYFVRNRQYVMEKLRLRW